MVMDNAAAVADANFYTLLCDRFTPLFAGMFSSNLKLSTS